METGKIKRNIQSKEKETVWDKIRKRYMALKDALFWYAFHEIIHERR